MVLPSGVFDNPENLTFVTELLTTADTYTGGYIGAIIWIVLGAGTFLLTSQFSTRESLLVTSFVMLTISLLLKFFFNLLGDTYVYGSAVLFISMLIISFTGKDSQGA